MIKFFYFGLVVFLLLITEINASLTKEEEELLASCYNLATAGLAKRQASQEDLNRFLCSYKNTHPEDGHQPTLSLLPEDPEGGVGGEGEDEEVEEGEWISARLKADSLLGGPNIFAIGKRVKKRLERRKNNKKKANNGPDSESEEEEVGEEKKEKEEVVDTMVSTFAVILGPFAGGTVVLAFSILFYFLLLKPRLDLLARAIKPTGATTQIKTTDTAVGQ